MPVSAYLEIPLSRGLVARVSPEDYPRLNQFKWCVCFEGSSRKPYAVRFETLVFHGRGTKGVRRKRVKRKVKMHREVLDLPRKFEPGYGLVSHHVDGDGLNNTRDNLRAVTFTENARLAAERRRKNCEPYL